MMGKAHFMSYKENHESYLSFPFGFLFKSLLQLFVYLVILYACTILLNSAGHSFTYLMLDLYAMVIFIMVNVILRNIHMINFQKKLLFRIGAEGGEGVSAGSSTKSPAAAPVRRQSLSMAIESVQERFSITAGGAENAADDGNVIAKINTNALILDKRKRRIKSIITNSTLVFTLLVFFCYPFTIIPFFIYSDIIGKMAIVLIVHPIIMETVIIAVRSSSGNGNKGKSTEPIRDYISVFLIESYLILVRRIMLCNLGSFQATTIAIIITGIEETLTRVTIVQRDLWYREYVLGKPEPSPEEAAQLKKVWATAVFHSMFAETSSIILSSIMYILYASHRMTFNLGYINETDAVDSGSLIIQMLLELLNELCVDSICTYVELHEGIDVLSIIGKVDHPIVLIGWSNVLVFSAFFALNSFKTIPNMVFCDTNEICTCSSSAYPLYENICKEAKELQAKMDAGADMSNATVSQTADKVALATSSLGEIANMTTVVIGVLVVVVMVVIIFFTLFMIQRRREKKDMKEMEEALKAKELTPDQIEMVAAIMEEDKKAKNPNASHSSSDIARLEIKYKQIKIIKRNIGRGAVGDVHKAKWNQIDVAVKQLTTINEDTMRSFRREILLTSQLRHPNIIALMGAIWSDKIVGIVLEFATGGSLYDALNNKASANWNWTDPKLKICIDIAQGISYLHNSTYYDEMTGNRYDCVLHRDLKTANVLLTSTFTAKVSDFGASKAISREAMERTITGTPVYMAPEVVRGEKYDASADVYSFGIVIYAMTLKDGNVHAAFEERLEKELGGAETKNLAAMSAANDGIRPLIDPMTPKTLKNLIQSCWDKRPGSRPGIDEVVTLLETKIRNDVSKAASQEKEDAERQEKRLGEAKKGIVEEARYNMRNLNPNFKVVLIRASTFLKMGKLEPLGQVRDRMSLGEHYKIFQKIKAFDEFLLDNVTIYLSHSWNAASSPDDADNSKYTLMNHAVTSLKMKKGFAMDKAWVWVDYSCIDFTSSEQKYLASQHLPLVCGSLGNFLAIAPCPPGVQYGGDEAFLKYASRGWCKSEMAHFITRNGFDDIYIVSDCKHSVIPPRQHLLTDCFDILKGTFHCCENLHKSSQGCEKKALLFPMIGLYCELYKRRYSKKEGTFWQRIEDLGGKKVVFPDYYEVRSEIADQSGGKTVVTDRRPLFSGLLEVAEKAIDFENMMEAAAGETRGGGGRKKGLGERKGG